MARQQRFYKVDVKQVAQDIALASVTDDNDIKNMLLNFCEFYSIPVSAEDVKENELIYQRVSEALAAQKKTPEEKPKK